MYNESAQEFVIDRGMYYPSATNYGYICTGLESPGDWDDHHRVFGVDGQNIQFIGSQTESMPYVYYTPSYGYTQSPYNPYNPYIPGAMIGADGSFVGAQQYYIPSYENGSSSPAYYPMVAQPGFDTFTSGTADQFMDMTVSTANRVDLSGFTNNSSSVAAPFALNTTKVASNHTNIKVSEGLKRNGGQNKLTVADGGVTPNSVSDPASSHILQGRAAQTIDSFSNGKTAPNHNQLKVTHPSGNGLSNFGSSANGLVVADKVRPKLPFGKTTTDMNGNPNVLVEQNCGPRTGTSNTVDS